MEGGVFLAGAVSPGQPGFDLLPVDIDAVAMDDGNGLFLPVCKQGLVLDIFSGAELFQGTGGLDGLRLAGFGRVNAGEPDSDGLVFVEDGQGIAAANAEQGGSKSRQEGACQQAGDNGEKAGGRHGGVFVGKVKIIGVSLLPGGGKQARLCFYKRMLKRRVKWLAG